MLAPLLLGVAAGIATLDLVFGQGQAASFILFSVVVKIQADYAAARFVKICQDPAYRQRLAAMAMDGSWIPPEFNTNSAPKSQADSEKKYQPKLAELAAPKSEAKQAQKEPQQEKKAPPKTEPLSSQRASARTPPKIEPYKKPNFTGKPHEVLGVQETAPTGVIVGAFRHWVKEFHPDHNQTTTSRRATEQARKIVAAKKSMLEARQKNRAQKKAA